MVRCKIKATFAPPTFEDKGKVANTPLWYNVSLPRYNLYQEHKREITHMGANHGANATSLAFRYKHTAMVQCFTPTV